MIEGKNPNDPFGDAVSDNKRRLRHGEFPSAGDPPASSGFGVLAEHFCDVDDVVRGAFLLRRGYFLRCRGRPVPTGPPLQRSIEPSFRPATVGQLGDPFSNFQGFAGLAGFHRRKSFLTNLA
jgi:hypothetical protein